MGRRAMNEDTIEEGLEPTDDPDAGDELGDAGSSRGRAGIKVGPTD
jgi:hypothetical protein